MQETLTHWSVATGRDVKVRTVTVTPPAPAPIRPTPLPLGGMAQPSTNGRVSTPVSIPS
jgi:hypothetical protein